jgi:hypothetical protein
MDQLKFSLRESAHLVRQFKTLQEQLQSLRTPSGDRDNFSFGSGLETIYSTALIQGVLRAAAARDAM